MFLFLRGAPKIQNFPNYQNFYQLGLTGVIKFPIFPKFKKVQNILGEGWGQENFGLFPLFGTFLNPMASLTTFVKGYTITALLEIGLSLTTVGV